MKFQQKYFAFSLTWLGKHYKSNKFICSVRDYLILFFNKPYGIQYSTTRLSNTFGRTLPLSTLHGITIICTLTIIPTAVSGILATDTEARYEIKFWESVKNSKDVADYEAYLEVYPEGTFAPLARSRVKRYGNVNANRNSSSIQVEAIDLEYKLLKNANLRIAPTTNSKRIGKLKSGSRIYVTGRVVNRSWYRVRTTSGNTAYVYSKLLQKPLLDQKPASPRNIGESEFALMTVQKFHVVQDCPSCPEMVVLPPGTFLMGNNQGDRSEKPAHKVSIKHSFAIGKYEITVKQWNACVSAGGCQYKVNQANYTGDSPIRDVSWNDAQEYIQWLSRITDIAYRLPTEAEWEYAARGGTHSRYWWGENRDTGKANCKDCGGDWSKKAPAEVTRFPANPFGIYGMNGGVWEWVSDCWHKSYLGAPKDGADWQKFDCRENVIRGGSWRNDSTYIHSASRFKYDTNVRYLLNGFRVARVIN